MEIRPTASQMKGPCFRPRKVASVPPRVSLPLMNWKPTRTIRIANFTPTPKPGFSDFAKTLFRGFRPSRRLTLLPGKSSSPLFAMIRRIALLFLVITQLGTAAETKPTEVPQAALPAPVNPDALATLVQSDQAGGPSLTLAQAMRLAIDNNFTGKISGENVASARARVDQARAPVLPQVGVGLGYQRVNDDQSAVESGFSPESQTNLSFNASQMIYNDAAVTGLRTSRRDLEAAEQSDASVRLDIAEQAGIAYVRVLSIASSLRIAEENLRITRENLELARIRRDVGTAGPEEVLRFESEEARQESTLWTARARLHDAVNQLNRILGEEPDRSWSLADLSLETDVFSTSFARLIPLANSPESSGAFRSASIGLALARSPDLASLRFSSEAQELRLAESRRSFIVPDVVAEFEYLHVIDAEYAEGTFGAAEEDDSWTFLVGASLPIFEGGGRFGEIRQARSGLRRIAWEEARQRQSISVDVSNALASLAGSWQSIRLSRIASDRAEKNLEIVQDKYEQGSVSIVDLLDAQNNATVQKQNASIELYRFFQDLISYQRTLSWMEPLADEASRDEIVAEFQSRIPADLQPAARD